MQEKVFHNKQKDIPCMYVIGHKGFILAIKKMELKIFQKRNMVQFLKIIVLSVKKLELKNSLQYQFQL